MFANLPEEIILNILSRIPVKSVLRCKCVCKSWRKLLETPHFARSHSDNSKPDPDWLLVNQSFGKSTVFKTFEIERGSSYEHHGPIDLDTEEIFNGLPQERKISIEGSINGLIFLRKMGLEEYYICNPITRECMELPATPPHEFPLDYSPPIMGYGFGTSRSSGQYKVVRMLEQLRFDQEKRLIDSPQRFICQVFTLGTRSWRSFDVALGQEELDYNNCSTATLLNGNLHWLFIDTEGSCWVSCFDLETEDLTKSRAPIAVFDFDWSFQEIGVLRGCLCLCDDSDGSEFVIYRMSCYEDKSWVKECVIHKGPDVLGGMYKEIRPRKVFGEEDVLVVLEEDSALFLYSNSAKECTDLIRLNFNDGVYCYFQTSFYTPSFVSLRDFETEDISVTKFE